MSKKYLFIPIAILILVVSFKILMPKGTALLIMGDAQSTQPTKKIDPVVSVGMEYGELIRKEMATAKPLAEIGPTHIGITSHHLPTAATLISEFYTTLKNSPGPRDVFIVVGPDHFERCTQAISTTKRPYLTPFGQLESNPQIIDALLSHGVNQEDSCFDGEHSIGVQAMFIKFLYPNAAIVPITFSSGTNNDQINVLATALAQYKDTVTIVVSVDFSHYQSAQTANRLDAFSGEQIKKMDGSKLTLEHMDSPPSIKFAIAFAKAIGAKNPHLLKHINSYDLTGEPENTTGYWDIFFTP